MPRRKRSRNELFVAMNGEAVGTLRRASGGALQFQYAETWLRSERATPISLSMPLSPNPYRDPVVSNFFDNLLPDGGEIRRRLQASLGADSARPFDLLAGAGGDCTGALQLFEGPEMPDVHSIDSVPVARSEIAETLREIGRRPLGMRPAPDPFRISLAGAHDKTALLRLGNEWHRPYGPTPTSHILKLPIGVLPHNGMDFRDSVENEWLCLRVLAAFGLPVPVTTMESFDGVRVLVVERFDREWSNDGRWLVRLPHEDVCQALGIPSARKYESDGGPGVTDIMDILWQANDPEWDRCAFFKANVLYWMLAATDGHAKNFSLALHPQGRYNLAPFYDVVSAYPVVARGQHHRSKLEMAMSVVGKKRQYAWERIQRRHWLATAKAARLPAPDAEAVLADCADRAGSVAREVDAALPDDFPDAVSEPILSGLTNTSERLL